MFPHRHDWFGLLYSGSEGKNTKKANLIISVLHPGADIPWLGSFDHLGLDTPSGDTEAFPIAPPRNLSFQSTANLSWISDSVLQVNSHFRVVTVVTFHARIAFFFH